MNKKAFKVVTGVDEGLLVSACISGVSQIVYKPGEWTTKKKYGPFVFDTLEHAKLFCGYERQQIWECETSADLHAIEMMVAYDCVRGAREKEIQLLMDEVIRCEERGEYAYNCTRCWLGTMMASSIKLTKRVEEI